MRSGPAIGVTLLVPGLLGPGTGPGGAGAGLGGAGPGAAGAEALDTAESPPPAASGARSGDTRSRGFFPALGIASRVRARSAGDASEAAESPPPAASGARSGATGFRGFFPVLSVASRVRARSAGDASDTAESPPPAASGARSGATGFRGFFPVLGVASRVRARSAGDASEAAEALVAGLDLHALDRLLARAGHDTEPSTDDSIEALAFRSFGYADRPGPAGGPVPGDATGPGADWPVAAVTALVDGEADGDGPWLRADPVHLRPDIADLVLFDAVDAGVSGEEARALAQIANEALRPGGPFVRAAHPHRWYVALEAPARMTTTPPSLAAGAGVAAAMPDGPDAARWRRWMNVVQMALHECPVNAERERRGAVPINSVWLWGGGRPPAAPEAPAPFVRAWSGDALVRGLARRAGIECGAPPAGAGAWLDRAPRPGAHLIGFDALYRAARRSDLDAWRAGLADFSASWAKPLLDALDRGDIARVSIHDERGHRFVATRRGRWRWRRRGGGLAARIAGAFASRH